MGNTDSQYSSFMAPGKPKSCTLKFHSRKEEVQSPHCWWRGSDAGSGYKSRGAGRGYPPQHKNGQPYGPRHYEHLAKGAGKGAPCGKPRPSSPLRYGQGDASRTDGHRYGYLESSGESVGPGAGGPPESRGSPKVLLSKDGSMRVEFTNTRRLPVESQPPAGHPSAPQDPSLRTSKGSSLSSEGSWYDSPWGNAAELADNVFACAPPADASSGYATYSSIRTEETGCGYTGSSGYNTFSSARTEDISPGFNTSLLFQTEDGTSQYANTGYNSNGYNTCSSGRTEDSGIGDSVILHPDQRDFSLGSPPVSLADLYGTPSMAAPFPTARFQDLPQHRASLASVLDVVIQEEGPDEERYSSHTLPCRKAGPVAIAAAGNSRKDSLKSRIRRLSDWTGSLSRKKRRLQEPCGGDISAVFCGPSDPGSAEPGSQVTCPSWNPLHTQNQAFSACSGSFRFPPGQQNPNDALRQNIYENFMQELETGGGGSGPERPEPSEEEADGEEGGGEAGSSSGGSLGSLEQLDLLFEKEQGVVRRAGWLSFKPLLTMHKDRKLEMVARRKWRQYWVTLKGCTLLFYETYGKSGPEQELSPRYALLAEDSVVQAIPEHPKKENVFCLSNAYGDVYLFQAASQTDLENWVTAIHSASASLLAKRQGKEDTVRLLRSQTRALLQKIDMDGKMKKMAELQLSVISDQRNRKAIESQILQWEQNLEKFNMDLFRVRCYLASLQGSELPNPKSLLAVAGRPSKTTLGRLGIFSVSSFHALICTRDDATLRRRCRSLSRGMRNKRGVFSSLKGLDSLTKHSREKKQSTSQVFEGQSFGLRGPAPSMCSSERLDVPSKAQPAAPSEGLPWYCTLEPPVCVNMPDDQAVTLPLTPDLLVSDVLSLACKERQLDPSQHWLRVRRRPGQDWDISPPAPSDPIRSLVYEELEVFPLNVFSIRLSRPHSAVDFGFAVTGHVDGLRRSHVYVSEVSPAGLAVTEGLRAGDEILVLNGASVSTLDLGLMQVFFSHLSLQLLLRREETSSQDLSSAWPDCDAGEPCAPAPPPPLSHPPPWPAEMTLVTQEVPESSVASAVDDTSPPPRLIDDTEQLAQEGLPRLVLACTVPTVSSYKCSQWQNAGAPLPSVGAMCGVLPQKEEGEAGHLFSKFSLMFLRQSVRDKLTGVLSNAASCMICGRPVDGIVLLNVETVCSLYHTFPEGCGVVVDGQRNPYSVENGLQRPCPRHMSISERLCKVIQELVDTEKSYVKDLGCLFNIYLTPLQNETFLSQDEMESLFGSLPEMLDFQKVFLHTLEERVASSPNFSSLETPEQFKKLLFSLGGSFLYYADHFKLYSGFCANHIKVQKVLERAKTDRAFKEFLEARNPTKQHSSTLESYLIKPVQRVLKYPLLLRELVSLTASESEEHSHLTEALKAMEKVASHINEMQKIYEDYGTVFDQLVAQQSGPEKEVTEISMGEFLIHSSLVWLNPLPSLGRMRKDPELTLFVFKRAVILVYRDNSKMKKRMTTSRSGDLDPFKFRWLIPVSAVQVRLGNAAGTENPCVWELVHTKSQVEGRPETVFQLCSSGLESKASVLKALRSLVRDGTRRGVLPERTPREHLGSLRRNQPPAARAGSLRRRPQRYTEAEKASHAHSDEGSVSSGSHPGDTRSEPQLPSRPTDLPSLESNTLGKRARLCSLTSALEAQLQRLNFIEEAVQGTGSQQGNTLRQEAHHAQRRSPDEPQCVDFNSMMGRDFSVQSLASVVNEDCFYDTIMGIQKAAIPTL